MEPSITEGHTGMLGANPGSLPALQVGEHIIADSEAIAEYLEESVPLPPALPTNLMQRAQVRALGRCHDTR